MLMSSNSSEAPEWRRFDRNRIAIANSLRSARDDPKTRRQRRPFSASEYLECVKHRDSMTHARLAEFICRSRVGEPTHLAAKIDNALKWRKVAITYRVQRAINLGVVEICREPQRSLLRKYRT